MHKYIFFSLLSLFSFAAIGQQNKPFIPLMRKIFHDNIDKSQRTIDRLDRKEDKALALTDDPEVNNQVAYSLFNKVDQLQDKIEADSILNSNTKIRLLRCDWVI